MLIFSGKIKTRYPSALTKGAHMETKQLRSAELAQWIEDQAGQVSAFQERCMAALEAQAAALLNLLLAGGGGALAFAVHLVEQRAETWLQAGITAATVWLFLVAAVLLLRAMWAQPVYGPGNDPAHLKVAMEIDLVSARLFQLDHQQSAIEHDRARNDRIGMWLNRCRILAAATPIVFLAAAWVVG